MNTPAVITKIGMKLQQHGPDIAAYGGTICMVTGGVWGAVRAVKYVPGIMEEHNEALEEIESYLIDEDYTLKDKKKDIRGVYFNTGKAFLKTFAGPGTLMIGGAVSNTCGYNKQKSNAAAAAAFAEFTARTLDKVLDNVEKKYGEEGRRYALYGEEAEEVEDEATGEKKKIYRGSESDDKWPNTPYAMTVNMGHLYEHACGNAIILLSELHDYEDMLNVQYHAGVPIYYYDVLKYIYGNELVKKLEEHGLLQKEIRMLGWFLKDPQNRENTDERAINLRAETWFGPKPGDEGLYESDMGGIKDKVWVRINPNIPGMVNLVNATHRVRVGGKYLSVI